MCQKNTILTHDNVFLKKDIFFRNKYLKEPGKDGDILKKLYKEHSNHIKAVFYTILSQPLKTYQFSVIC